MRNDRPTEAAARWLIPGLFAVTFVLMVLFPYPGSRKWDGLMTATVLSRWDETPASAIVYFAHPLVIPLTRLFALGLPFRDPLLVTTIRESFFAVGSAGLIYLFARQLWGRLPAVLTALAYLLPLSHWKLATWGEEKDTLTFFLLLFALPCAHLHGDVRLPALDRLSRPALRLLLGVTLALALMVHLQAALLVPFFLLTTLLRAGRDTPVRQSLADLTWVLGVAALPVLVFYGSVIVGVNGITTLREAMAWFLAYHREGFFQTEYAWGEQLVKAYAGLRAYLVGEFPARWVAFECGLALALGIRISLSAWRHRPGLARACLIYLALHAGYFFNYQPWDAEAWAGASWAGVILLGLAFLEAEPRLRKVGVIVWMSGLAILATVDAAHYTARLAPTRALHRQMETVDRGGYGPLERRIQDHTPQGLLVQIADALMSPDGVVTVGDRHLANFFLVYTRRDPVVVPYLDRTEDELVRDAHLSVLSLLFYRPHLSSGDLLATAEQGRPLYYVSTERIAWNSLPLLLAGLQPHVLWRSGPYTIYEMTTPGRP